MGRVDESVWSSRSGGRSEVFALLFSPSPKQDDGQKKALRKTLQHPLWAQKLRILYPNLLGALPSCEVGGAAPSGGLPHCAAGLSAQGPAPPWGFCSSYQLSPSLPRSGEPRSPRELPYCPSSAVRMQPCCNRDSLPGYLKSGHCTYTTASRAVLVTQQELGRRGF